MDNETNKKPVKEQQPAAPQQPTSPQQPVSLQQVTSQQPVSLQQATSPQPKSREQETNIGGQLAKLELSDEAASAAWRLVEAVRSGNIDDNTARMIAHAACRNEELRNAEASGYLRGKNEKIDLLSQPDELEADAKATHFPQYRRRSFWADMAQ